MNSGPQHGMARNIASRIGLVLLLFLIWWGIEIFYYLAPFQSLEPRDVRLVVGLTLSFGTLVAAPAIFCLIGMDLIAKQMAFPWNVIVFAGLVVAGCGLYMMWLLNKPQIIPLQAVSDAWKVYGGHFLPIVGVAAVLLVRRVRKSM